MIVVDGQHIYLNRGDTGAVRIKSSGYAFSADDRCVFTLKAPDGSIVKQVVASLTEGYFDVSFLHTDTDGLAPGDGYYWGITYYMNPYYTSGNPVPVNGNIVYTPTKTTMPFTVWQKA